MGGTWLSTCSQILMNKQCKLLMFDIYSYINGIYPSNGVFTLSGTGTDTGTGTGAATVGGK